MKSIGLISVILSLIFSCTEEKVDAIKNKQEFTKSNTNSPNSTQINQIENDKVMRFMQLYVESGSLQHLDSIKTIYQRQINLGIKDPEFYLHRALIEEKINGYQSAKPYYKKTRDLVNWRMKHKDVVAIKHMKDLSEDYEYNRMDILRLEENIISGSKFFLAICEIMDGEEKKGIEQYKQLGKDNMIGLPLGFFEINKREDVLDALFPNINEEY